MKHLTAEQKRIWQKYYSWLDADRLLFVTTNSFYYGRPTGAVVNDRLVPGAIWRDEKTYRPAPEPANEKMDKALDRLYSEGVYSKPLDFLKQQDSDTRPGWERYREYNDQNDDPLGRYITYHPLVLKRIYELTEPILYGQREDIQQLVKEYQGGNRELLTRIKNQLGGLIYKAENEFSYSGNKELFTNLAGKFNKKLSKPNIKYSDDSPIGDSEDQRLMLITEPFIFDEADLQQTIDRSLTEALSSYEPDKGAKFKTWFYRIFKNDLLDLYREYKRTAKRGFILKVLTEELPPGNHSFNEIIKDYRAYLNRIKSGYDDLNEHLHPAFIESLTDNQKKWIALFLKILPDRLTAQLTADMLNTSLKTEYNIRQSLKVLFESNSAALKHYKELVIIERSKKKKLKKEPAFTKQQLTMKKQYKDFKSNEGYKKGICSGSSFFPVDYKITD